MSTFAIVSAMGIAISIVGIIMRLRNARRDKEAGKAEQELHATKETLRHVEEAKRARDSIDDDARKRLLKRWIRRDRDA